MPLTKTFKRTFMVPFLDLLLSSSGESDAEDATKPKFNFCLIEKAGLRRAASSESSLLAPRSIRVRLDFFFGFLLEPLMNKNCTEKAMYLALPDDLSLPPLEGFSTCEIYLTYGDNDLVLSNFFSAFERLGPWDSEKSILPRSLSLSSGGDFFSGSDFSPNNSLLVTQQVMFVLPHPGLYSTLLHKSNHHWFLVFFHP
jgi:hypothetical protein